MVQSSAKTVSEYLEKLSPDRRKAIAVVRAVIRKNLPEGYKEVMQYGMISYIIPFSRYPETYNNQPLAYVSLASQKNHMAIYLMNIYGDRLAEQWFDKAYKTTGKKIDMGKSCVRFKKLEDLPLQVIGKAVARTSVDDFIKKYESSQGGV